MQSFLRSYPTTTVMGILNITPDSFSDGGKYFTDVNAAVKQAQKMVVEGADIIDIGGESTRPGAEAVTAEVEIQRVIPIIQAIRAQLGNQAIISIDTYKSTVAEAALRSGAQIINSLGGNTFDSQMYQVAQKYNVPVLVYHIKGEPRTMQQREPHYSDVIAEIKTFFKTQLLAADQAGIAEKNIWLDPGIGFGKTVAQNLEIITRLAEFQTVGLPIAVGVSRKSHLGKILQDQLALPAISPPEERLEACLAETAIAVMNGATIVRTHDVLSTKKCLAVVDALKSINSTDSVL